MVLTMLETGPSRGRKGDAERALNFLKYHGIKTAVNSPQVLSGLTLDGVDLSFPNQHFVYVDEDDIRREGLPTLASGNMNEVKDITLATDVILNHPIYGSASSTFTLLAR